MPGPTHDNPPLTPALLAGVALRPLPPVLLQPFLDIAMAVLSRHHPDLFAHLADMEENVILIDPVDLPFGFLLRLSKAPRLRAIARDAPPDMDKDTAPTATIRGPLAILIQLLDGRLDGDALFFSRDLVVEGNMEAVVMLRNAVDGAGIDLREDLLSVFGPLSGPARLAAGGASRVFTRLERDIETLKNALTASVDERCEAQAAEIRALRKALEKLQREQAPVARPRRTSPAKVQSR
ncbi:MAG TPA: SCP2 sterol-binding domain-containing protein [Rhodospirillales bacterium]|jgi:predicted lipid carrier protein YhbT|nr:SCP2 sterol-binding domain-containing protein [Rhodospirillales bacterium]